MQTNTNSTFNNAGPSSSRTIPSTHAEVPLEEMYGHLHSFNTQQGNPTEAYPHPARQTLPAITYALSEDEGYVSASLSPASNPLEHDAQQLWEICAEAMAQASDAHGAAGGHDEYDDVSTAGGHWYDPSESGCEAAIARLEEDILDFSQYDKENCVDPTLDIPAGNPSSTLLPIYGEELAGPPHLSYMYDYSLLPTQVLAQVGHLPQHPPFPPYHSPTYTHGPSASLSPLAFTPFPEAGPSRLSEDTPELPVPTPTAVATKTKQASRRSTNKRARAASPDPSTPAPPLRRIRPRLDTVPTLWRTIGNTVAPAAVAPTLGEGAPVAGPSRLIARAEDPEEEDVEEEASDDETPTTATTGAAGTRVKRPRRRHVTVAAVTLDLPDVTCPVKGCKKDFVPTMHDENRAHLIEHYGKEAIEGSEKLECLWRHASGKCKESVRGTCMITHVHKEHVGLAFICPMTSPKCEWKSSRSKDLRQHFKRQHPGWTLLS